MNTRANHRWKTIFSSLFLYSKNVFSDNEMAGRGSNPYELNRDDVLDYLSQKNKGGAGQEEVGSRMESPESGGDEEFLVQTMMDNYRNSLGGGENAVVDKFKELADSLNITNRSSENMKKLTKAIVDNAYPLLEADESASDAIERAQWNKNKAQSELLKYFEVSFVQDNLLGFLEHYDPEEHERGEAGLGVADKGPDAKSVPRGTPKAKPGGASPEKKKNEDFFRDLFGGLSR